jgi:transposase
MRDTELYAQILGVTAPWQVTGVRMESAENRILVELTYDPDARTPCPECGKAVKKHDRRRREWRHLDTCQLETRLVADVPRTECPLHGVLTMQVPWAEGSSRFTALFEALVINWLKEAPVAAVARRVRMSWDETAGVMDRAVARGLARRTVELPEALAVDETSFQKRHEYVTIVHDPRGPKKRVLHVADGRGKEALKGFLSGFSAEERERVRVVAMDMHEPYILAVAEALPDGANKVAFDKFHVAGHLGDAVNKVRREEHEMLQAAGDQRLKGTRFWWLSNPERSMSEKQWLSFESLRCSSLKTARAWSIKEAAMEIWEYAPRDDLRSQWIKWYGWAIRSQLDPIKAAARTVKRHLDGIILAAKESITNASAEGLNSVVQMLKHVAHGYRNRERFRNAIYFHLGGLDLHPGTIGGAHC